MFIIGTRFEGLADLDDLYSSIGDDYDYSWFWSSSSTMEEDTTTNGTRRRRQVNDYSFSAGDIIYPDWGEAVTDADDWEAFYNNSKTSDFSDLRSIVKPTREELLEYGHQAKDFILQCTYDTVSCSYEYAFFLLLLLFFFFTCQLHFISMCWQDDTKGRWVWSLI